MATDYAAAIAKLEAALAGAERVVQAGDERIEFRSPAEIRAQLDYMRAQQAAAGASSGRAPANVTVARFDRS